MLARVADSLYWIGRYLERAEHTARLVEVHTDLMLYQRPAHVTDDWLRMASALHADGVVTDGDPNSIAQALSVSPRHSGSMLSCVASARENARQVREVISSEMWTQLNRLHMQVRQAALDNGNGTLGQPFYRSLREGIHLFEGLTDATFIHDAGWHFLRLGRYVERAIATATLLGGYADDLHERSDRPVSGNDVTWAGLLRSCTGLEAYTRAYTADPRPRMILEFLLLGESFPHSLRYCIEQSCSSIAALERASGGGIARSDELIRRSGRLRAQLEFANIDEILAEAPVDYLADLAEQCESIHDLIQDRYIAYPIEEVRMFG